MRLRKTTRRYGCEISIAPLIDVVFLLIIFFMTISQISSVEASKLDLPSAEQGEASSPAAMGRLVINIHADGRLVMSGQRMTPEGIAELVARERGRPGGEAMEVILRGDREAAWQDIARIMQTCARQGIFRVRVAVAEGEATDFGG